MPARRELTTASPARRSRRAAVALAVALVASAACAACSSSPTADPTGSASTPSAIAPPTSSGAPSTSGTRTGTSSHAPSSSSADPASRALAAMSLSERVGQLVMVDCPSSGVSGATRSALSDDHVGSVILDGTTRAGVAAVKDVTGTLRSLEPRHTGLFIATDQEGGLVQRLQGSGFDRIPSGVDQGHLSPTTLRTDAHGWGEQLRSAGVNVNLAPVLDVVPAGGGSNPPIGDLDRQYGSTPSAVTSHGLAFAAGMTAAGVDPVVKHFPGLGRVSGNTDVASGVTDSTTTATDANLAPFRAAVKSGVPFVMMSTAIYSRIDPGTPAAFSHRIVTGVLRGELGFGGVVISDDVGAADQVSGYSPGERAVRFVAAGGDVVLTVVADQAGTMTDALAAKARSDAGFRKLVDAAALRVLRAKQARGLLR